MQRLTDVDDIVPPSDSYWQFVLRVYRTACSYNAFSC